MTDSALQREQATYETHRADLVERAAGKYALIHGDEIVAVFDTQADAIGDGYRRYGNTPFMVKHVEAVETPHNFVSRLLAV
jgi:predicted RNA-binding protein with PIN domain